MDFDALGAAGRRHDPLAGASFGVEHVSAAPDFADFRYNFPGDHEASSSVVPCDVAHNQPEGASALGLQLSDSMGVASQDETCDDSSGTRETQRFHGGE